MHVKVEDDLPAGRLAELLDYDSIRAKGRHRRHRDPLARTRHLGEGIRTDVEDSARCTFWNNQGVTWRAGHDVHKRQRLLVLTDFVTRNLATKYFGKEVLVIMGPWRIVSLSVVYSVFMLNHARFPKGDA